MPPEHFNNSSRAGLGPRDEESRAEILGFPLFDDVEYYLASHPEGLCAMHGYHPAPDWDALLDCGREPADPREHYRWKVTREAFDSIKPFLKEREAHLTRYRRDRAYQASVAALARRDPLYGRTMEIMDKLMGDLPEVVKELSMPTLAREFGPFLELYKELRHVAVAVESCRGHKRKQARRVEEAGRSLEHAGTGAGVQPAAPCAALPCRVGEARASLPFVSAAFLYRTDFDPRTP